MWIVKCTLTALTPDCCVASRFSSFTPQLKHLFFKEFFPDHPSKYFYPLLPYLLFPILFFLLHFLLFKFSCLLSSNITLWSLFPYYIVRAESVFLAVVSPASKTMSDILRVLNVLVECMKKWVNDKEMYNIGWASWSFLVLLKNSITTW